MDADTHLFCFHLPMELDDMSLFRLFAPFGSLKTAKVATDKITGRSRGFGFLTFGNYVDATNAIAMMNGHHVMGKHLKVQFKNPK